MHLFWDFLGHLNILICFMTLEEEMWYAVFLNISERSFLCAKWSKINLRKANKDRETNCPKIGWLQTSLISTPHGNCTCKAICYVLIFKSNDYYSVSIFPLVAFHSIDHSFLKLFGNQVTTVSFYPTSSFVAVLLTQLEFFNV